MTEIKRAQGGQSARDYTIAISYYGEKTEDEYFRSWKLLISPSRLNIIPFYVKSGGNPLKAVEKTINKKRKLQNYAELWCVTDCDDASHDDINKAKDLAEKNDIRLVLSNRCFEIWFVLHFEKAAKPINNCDDSIAAVSKHVLSFSKSNKSVPFATLFPRTNQALENAAWLRTQNCINPSTNVDPLIRKLRDNM